MIDIPMRIATGLLLSIVLAAAAAAEPPPGKMAVEDVFQRLPPGAILAGGWIERQMVEDSEGWVRARQGQSLEGDWLGPSYGKRPFWQPYVDHLGTPVEGEYQAHWMDLVFRLGWTAGLDEYKQLGRQCVDDVLAHVGPDGYLGVDKPECRFNNKGVDGNYELWSYGENLNGLLNYYRYTRRRAGVGGLPQGGRFALREVRAVRRREDKGSRRLVFLVLQCPGGVVSADGRQEVS